jgi:hypothetical protein
MESVVGVFTVAARYGRSFLNTKSLCIFIITSRNRMKPRKFIVS